MKLSLTQAIAQIGAGKLPIYWFFSEDPFLLEDACEQCRQQVRKTGIEEIYTVAISKQFDTDQLDQTTQNQSLFSQQQALLLKCESMPPETLTKWLLNYLINPSADITLFVFSGRLSAQQQRTKWFKLVEQVGAHIPLWPPARHELCAWLGQLAKRYQLALSTEAVQWLAECTEGNLFAAKQTFEKLAATQSKTSLTLDDVQTTLQYDAAHFSVFEWANALLLGDVARAIRILEALQQEQVEPTILVWSLAKELRLIIALHLARQPFASACKSLGIWPKRQPPFQQALRRLTLADCHRALQQLAQIDRVIKGIEPGSIWLTLHKLTATLCSPKLAA